MILSSLKQEKRVQKRDIFMIIKIFTFTLQSILRRIFGNFDSVAGVLLFKASFTVMRQNARDKEEFLLR